MFSRLSVTEGLDPITMSRKIVIMEQAPQPLVRRLHHALWVFATLTALAACLF